jgi:hypothetical protein
MTVSHDFLSASALEQAVADAEPAALLVPSRILRRVIKQHSHLTGIGLRVPHRKVYVLHREALLAMVARSELDIPADRVLPDRLILVQRPTPERLSELTVAEALTLVWRLVFHGRVHLALERALAEGRLTALDIKQRILEIGRTEFEEIRRVLRAEDLLLPPRDETTTYIEFVSVFLELRYFASGFLPTYFPSLENLDRAAEIVGRDVDGDRLFNDTRPPGAPDDPDRSNPEFDETVPVADTITPSAPRKFSERLYRRLAEAAERVSPRGNMVRSAVLQLQASKSVEGEAGRDARLGALNELMQLARRLQNALGFSDSERGQWEQALTLLIDQASAGGWPPSLRLLYDLQRVCVDHEKGVYSLDLWGWIKTGFRESIKRPLPGQREVMINKHLRAASNRLAQVPLGGRARLRLAALLNSAKHRAENNLRSLFRPLIVESLDAVSLLPHNLPERVARDKLIDELLDRIVERGFLTMSDLRDAISRGNLKLPDVTQLRELASGDQVLQADRQLSQRLAGVYRRGEVYLRLPQQLSSLAFGTPPGRFITQYIAIPFGGAYVLLEFVQHVLDWIRGHEAHPTHVPEFSGIEMPALPAETPVDAFTLNTFTARLLLGLVLLGLLHHTGFRRLCFEGLMALGRLVYRLTYQWPKWLLEQPWVREIVQSWPFKALLQYVVKPALLTVLVLLAVGLWRGSLPKVQTMLATFLGINVLLNSRLGRTVDEVVTDWVVTAWHKFRIRVVAALIKWIVDIFQGFLEGIERLLYAVDEWLRFRTGESDFLTVIKAVLAAVWSVVNYIIRFFVNLLIEPQINPIKHFPVVTVSHKILLPLIPVLFGFLKPLVGKDLAAPLATAIIFLTPGIFGFLVWELKENWRLYAANRPPNLRPNALGHHGETLVQFLRPGFRSGTVPKIYTRLRRANRRAYWTRNWQASAKQIKALHEVEEALRQFVDRELGRLLEISRGWQRAQLTAGEIHLGINQIGLELYSPDHGEDSVWLSLEEHAGWLVAGVRHRGWLDRLDVPARLTFENALAGFYKMAGVQIIREELELLLAPADADYAITDQGLVAYDSQSVTPRVLCRLSDGDASALWDPAREFDRRRWPIDPRKVLFSNRPLSWQRWVETWQRDQSPTRREQSLFDSLV